MGKVASGNAATIFELKSVRKTVEAYCHALEQGHFDKAAEFLDPDDVLRFWQVLCDMEAALGRIGEGTTTFGILGDLEAPESFREFAPKELMVAFLRTSMGQPSDFRCEITTADEVGPGRGLAVYSVAGFANTLDLVSRSGTWYIKLRVGVDQMASVFLHKVEDFERRQARDRAASPGTELAQINLVGYADPQGTTIIEPRFAEGADFSEGLAAVKLVSQWGYIDTSGRVAIKAQFLRARSFSEGVAWVAPYAQEDLLFALIDKEGKQLIPPRFNGVEPFSEGLAAAREERLWGYIDKKGDWIIQPRFVFAEPFSEGLAEVGTEDGEYLYIDPSGQPLE